MKVELYGRKFYARNNVLYSNVFYYILGIPNASLTFLYQVQNRRKESE